MVRAVILAGGKGTRLVPYTRVIPKPLMPIGDRPILQFLLEQFAASGIRRATLAVGYMADLIEAYFGNGNKFGVELEYSREPGALGTAGPLSLIPGLEHTFIVTNGDLLTDMRIQDLLAFHRKTEAMATIGMYRKEVKIDLGVIHLNGDHTLKDYEEKPTLSYDVSMGMYVFEPGVLEYIPQGEYFDFPDLVKKLLAAGERVVGYPFEGYWLDVGRHEDFERAQEDAARIRERLGLDELVDSAL